MTNNALIYRRPSKWPIASALAAAVLIHLSAVAIAFRQESPVTEPAATDSSPIGIELVDELPTPPDPDTSVPLPLPVPAAARFRPEKIILFGSYAYGTPNEDSDVDIMILMDCPRPRSKQTQIRCAVRPPFPLDLLLRTPREFAQRRSTGSRVVRAPAHSSGFQLARAANKRDPDQPGCCLRAPRRPHLRT